MEKLLENKNILVAVTGSIAVYKSLELIRLYKKAGANVKVIMSEAAKKFINPITFETISQNTVLDDTNEDWSTHTVNNHISIGKSADILVFAPATANTINKLSYGIADNIILQTALAYTGTKLLCPAANTNMIQNPITVQSLNNLRASNFKFVDSISKELACRDVGNGAMAEVEDIYHATIKELFTNSYWENRDVVLNGGGTIEKIDDVRYISNFSSGKMAANLALALYYKGANVSLVTTKELELPKAINTIKVQSSQDMLDGVNESISLAKSNYKKPFFFAVAAVSDYVVKEIKTGKIKKNDIGESWNLELKQNIDLLASIVKDDIYTIGFKAEMDKDNAYDNASNMLEKKSLDGVCLNILDQNNNFGSDRNKITFIKKDGSCDIKEGEKLEVSINLLDEIKKAFSE